MSDRLELDEVLASIDDVDGWLSAGQASALLDSAHRCPPHGTIVEIGSFRGRSTIVLASGAAPGVEIIAIDPHAGNDRGPQEIDGYEEQAEDDHEIFHENLRVAGVDERVRHVREFSDVAHDEVDGSIDVLYVDGAHRYRPALNDIRSWGERVDDGGALLIHDAFSSIGVTLAILRSLLPGSRFRYVGRARSLAIYRADLPAGARHRIVNSLRQVGQLPWFIRNVVVKVVLTLGLGRIMRLVGKTPPEWPY